MKLNGIKAVIFDLDGTLADTEPFHRQSRSNLLNEFNLPSTAGSKMVGISLREFWGDLAKQYGLPFSGQQLTDRNLDEVCKLIKINNLKPFCGAEQLLKELKERGLTLAVASSSDRKYVMEVLSFLNLEKYFSNVTCGDEVKNSKPDPEIYLKAAAQCGVRPEEAVAVEDSEAGITSAKGANIICIGYNNPYAKVKQSYSLCDYVINNLAEALAFFD